MTTFETTVCSVRVAGQRLFFLSPEVLPLGLGFAPVASSELWESDHRAPEMDPFTTEPLPDSGVAVAVSFV